MKSSLNSLAILLTILILISCKEDSSDPASPNTAKIAIELQNFPPNSMFYFTVLDGDATDEEIQNAIAENLTMGIIETGNNATYTKTIQTSDLSADYGFEKGSTYKITYLWDVPPCNFAYLTQEGIESGDGGGIAVVNTDAETNTAVVDYENVQWKMN